MSRLVGPEGEPGDCYKAVAWVREASKNVKQGIAVEMIRVRISET